ncbi:MAG: XTP/dITP diphosphatase [Chloroflexota bacterium]
MRKLLIATNNSGKIREYRAILAGIPFVLTSLYEERIDVDVEERGETFAENAVAKAQAYAKVSGLLTLADDSGLEVDALGGAPGVRSARYAGEGATDADRIALLLSQLRNVPLAQRTGRFRCVIAVAEPGGEVATVEGHVEGLIAEEPRGSQGFGYDPVFLLSELGRTMAELSPVEKNSLSHRAIAARAARGLLESSHASH